VNDNLDERYRINAEILRNLNRLEVIREKIRLSPIIPKEEYRLRREAMISMIHHSTAIEGNTLSPFEVEQALEGKTVRAPKREIDEVKNYKKALDYISRQKSKQLTEKHIIKIHELVTKQILPPDSSGKYRKGPVYVVRRTALIQEIRYTAPDHKMVKKLVNTLCRWINDSKKKELSPIVIAGIAHAEIAAIHPFSDGNGRTARLLATLILYSAHYDFRKLFALENFYNTNRPGYYDAIHLGKNYPERASADHTPWLGYFVRGFLVEMELVMDKITPFQYLKSRESQKIVLSMRELKILDFLQEFPHATSSELQQAFTVNLRTLQRDLSHLIKKGLITKNGEKKNAVYRMAKKPTT
jgi:Fic family protein